MAQNAFAPIEIGRNPFENGEPVRFDLPSQCVTVSNGLLCGQTEAYLCVKPYGSAFHYERRCANGHFIDNVKHAEVELHFGIPRTATSNEKSVATDALTPSKRVAFNVLVRDRFACVYCGMKSGDRELDDSAVVIGADHIIAKALIDPADIRRDRELLQFARDRQLVSACRTHNSAKGSGMLGFDVARDLFIRHVLKGEPRGRNLGQVDIFDRLYRVVALQLRRNGRAS